MITNFSILDYTVVLLYFALIFWISKWVSKKQVFIDAVDIKSPAQDMDDTIQTFSEMLKFENFIVGNSTFSLIPGILRETSTSKIIIAEPWFKKSNPIKNIPKHWIKINNL